MAHIPTVPTLTTPRLLLRGWRLDDIGPYAAMLADPETARFITRRGQPYGERETWGEVAFFLGHWQLLGHGMFVIEDRATGAFLGRAGTLAPNGWPGFEAAWALAPAARGQGFATEAARAVIGWAIEHFAPERIISIIDPENTASQRVAERVGERRTDEQFAPFGRSCDIWALPAAASPFGSAGRAAETGG